MKHERKCHDCGNVAEHNDNVTPEVLCKKCGSQDTRLTKHTPPKEMCPMCGGTGSADSGGVTPWGAWIDVPCGCEESGDAHGPTPDGIASEGVEG